MSPELPTLALLLDSPLQSWGERSRFNRRDSGPHPTKSGVVALLAAARGLDKHADDEAEALRPLSALRLATVLLPRCRGNGRGATAPVPPSRLTDYQTIGGGYDEKTQTLSIPRKASRGGVFGTVQTWRDYLLDTRFGVLLQGDAAELSRCSASLENPVWGLCLGRKSCPPAVPVTGPVHPSATAAWSWLLQKSGYPSNAAIEDFDRMEELPRDSPDADFHLHDQPVSFGKREFHSRPVRHHRAAEP